MISNKQASIHSNIILYTNLFRFLFILLISVLYGDGLSAQVNRNTVKCGQYADSVRQAYHIPELGYAVVSSDNILDLRIFGYKRAGTSFKAELTDRFHIGSNTKAITAFIAATLIKEKKLSWDTKFFNLFPELKKNARHIYDNITLGDLVSFRGKLPSYTYTFDKPTRKEIKGSPSMQRYHLAKYFLSQDPMREENGLTPSNVDYILAGLMLEKASGKSYKALVTNLGKSLGIKFHFDYPNSSDVQQTWGHDTEMHPIPPANLYKLNWLLSAGNINISLVDYVKFIRMQLRGIKGQESLLTKNEFDYLLFGLPVFSMGWFNKVDDNSKNTIAFNIGNAGAFITEVQIIKKTGIAYIVFTNSASKQTEEGVEILLNHLKQNF